MDTKQVGQTLVDLCKEGKNIEAVDRLFAADAVSEEAMEMPGGPPRVTKGIDAIRGKNQWWFDNNEVHGGTVTGPFPNGDEFAVFFTVDCTAKAGPFAGQRINMEEVGLYKVKDGKVVHERFFYSAG